MSVFQGVITLTLALSHDGRGDFHVTDLFGESLRQDTSVLFLKFVV